MSKIDNEIYAKVTLEEEGTGIEEVILIPISAKDYFEVRDKLQGKNMKIKEIYTNCDISIQKLLKKEDNVMTFSLKLQALMQDLNILSNKEEVQAITECVTSEIEEVVRFVKKGNYHFYHELTVEDIEEGITAIGDENSEEITSENLNANGYYETSTGIMYLAEKSTK